MKKIIFNVGAIIVFLLLCWRIGVALHPNGDVMSEEGKDNSEVEISSAESTIADNIAKEQNEMAQDMLQLKEESLVFLNAESVSDNPWGFTAGIIDVDQDGQCLFLTPGTGVVIDGISDVALEDDLNMQFKIHLWVAKDSDGAGITISLKDQDANTIRQERMLISAQDGWQSMGDPIKTGEIRQVELLCDGGDNSNETADWLIIKLPFSIVRD